MIVKTQSRSTHAPEKPPAPTSAVGDVNFFLQSQMISDAEPLPGPEQRPRTTKDLGVRSAIVDDLALKTLYTSGPFSVFELGKRMRISYDVASELFNRMRSTLLCQVTGMKGNRRAMPAKRLNRWSSGPNTNDGRRMAAPGKAPRTCASPTPLLAA